MRECYEALHRRFQLNIDYIVLIALLSLASFLSSCSVREIIFLFLEMQNLKKQLIYINGLLNQYFISIFPLTLTSYDFNNNNK